MINVVHLKNVTSKKQSKYLFEDSASQITHQKIIDIITLYEPNVTPDDVSISYYDQKRKKWLFVYRNSPALIYSEEDDEIREVTTQNLQRQRSHSWESIENIPRILKIRYKIYNEPLVTPDSIYQVQKHLKKCINMAQQFQKKFDGDTVDINIFWAGPHYTKEHRHLKKGMQVYQGKYCLKYNVNYKQPIHQIIKTVKQSNKRTNLKINEFNQKSLEKKNEFSIIYLVCHTEQKEKASVKNKQPIYQAPLLKNQSKSQQVSSQFSLQAPQLTLKNFSMDIKSSQVPEFLDKRLASSCLPREKADNKTKNQQTNHTFKKSESESTQRTMANRQVFFVGESKEGQLVKILPQDLIKMFENKEVQLLILHTSYPFQHFKLLSKNPKLQNIILINSNPIYHEPSCLSYLQVLFKNLLAGQNVSNAHQAAINFIETKYPNQFMCCCYHEHKPGCQFQKKCQINKYEGLHYMLHHNRCQCQESSLLQHYCKQKYDIIKNIYKKKVHSKNTYSFRNPFFYCCCLSRKQRQRQKHSLSNKFFLSVQSESNCKFQFKKGQIKGDIECLQGFDNQQKLIGNKKVIVKLLETFVPSKDGKNCAFFNLYGASGSGKKILTAFFKNLMIRKKIFKRIEKKQFKKFKDLEIAEKQGTLYYLIYRPKNNAFNQLQLERLSYHTSKKINAILITHEPLKLSIIGIQNKSQKLEPFNGYDCENYFKAKIHLTQIMKDKVHKFFEMTWKKHWKMVYYPDKFDFEGILSIIADSSYSGQYQNYLLALQNFSAHSLYQYLLFMGFAINVPQQQSKFLQKYFAQNRLYNEQIKIIKKQHNNRQKNHNKRQAMRQKQIILERCDLLNITKSKKYLLVAYQKYCDKISIFCKNLIDSYYYYTSDMKMKYIGLYDATTDDPESLINMFYANKIQEILRNEKTNSLGRQQLDECLKGIDIKHRLIAALSFVLQILQAFYLYEIQQEQIQAEILQSCLFIINSAVIFRKGIHDIKQEDSSFHQIQSATSIMLPKQEQKIHKNIVAVRKNSKYSDDQFDDREFHQRGISSPNQTLHQPFSHKKKLSEDPLQEQEDNFANSMSLHHPASILKNHIKSQQKYRKDESDFKKNHNYLSKKFILSLLQKILKKKLNVSIKLTCESLVLQLLFEQIYQSHHISPNVLNEIDSHLKSMKNAILKEERQFWAWKGVIQRLDYDIGISLILKKTLGGRKKLSKQDISQIQHFKDQFHNKNKQNTNPNNSDSFEKVYDQIILQLCQDKQVYNRMTQKLITSQRYNIKAHQQKIQFLLSQLQVYKILIQYWEKYYKFLPGKNQNTSKDCYFSIVELFEELPKIQPEIKSSFMLNLYNDLKQISEAALNRLRNKMLVVFIANPITKKNYSSNQKRFLINFNQIIESKNRESLQNFSSVTINKTNRQNNLGQSVLSMRGSVYTSDNLIETDLDLQQDSMSFFTIKMKLNLENIQLLKKRKGCRYLTICADIKSDNHTIILGEKENSEVQEFDRNQLTNLLLEIPSMHFFICFPKFNQLAKCLQDSKMKINLEMVYFNFQQLFDLSPPQQQIIMLMIAMKIIREMEKGKKFEDAVNFVKNNIQISEILYKEKLLQKQFNIKKSHGDSKKGKDKHSGKGKEKQKQKDKDKDHKSIQRKIEYQKFKKCRLNSAEVNQVTQYYKNCEEAQTKSFCFIDDESQSQIISCEYCSDIIITSEYLNAIQKIVYNNNAFKGGFQDCQYKQFIHHFKFYLKQKMQCSNFVILPGNQKILSEIIRNNVLSFYYSVQKFVIIIENYVPTNCDALINHEIQFFFTDKKKLEIKLGLGKRAFKDLKLFNATFENNKKPYLIILGCDIQIIQE